MRNDSQSRSEHPWLAICSALAGYYIGSMILRRYWAGILYRMGLNALPARILTLLWMTALFLLVLLLLVLTGQVKIFRQRRTGFLKGLVPGGYILLFAAGSILYNLFGTGTLILPSAKLFLYYTVYFLLVALNEELLFRGIVADLILQNRMEKKKQRSSVILSVVLSGLIFSLSHLRNLSVADTTGVAIQVLGAFLMGMVLTAVYYRTNNIFVVIFLHAFNNVAAAVPLMLEQNKNGISGVISSYGIRDVLLLLAYIPVLLVILRKTKTNDPFMVRRS